MRQRRKWERGKKLTEEEADAVLAKLAPDWVEHLHWDDVVLNRIILTLQRLDGKRQTAPD